MLITGANRGIGLEFVRQYLADGWEVIATCRDPKKATDLETLANENHKLSIYPLDISQPEQIDQLAKAIGNQPIDHLINNAGTYGSSGEHFGNVKPSDMVATFATNTVGTLLVCQALAKNIELSTEKLIIAISTRVGSIADNTTGKNYSYRASKAALNMVMKSIAVEVQARGVRVLILHPGWVKTAMGGDNALITTEESVKGLRNIINTDHGDKLAPFIAFDGRELQW